MPTIKQPTHNDYLFAEENATWLNTPSPFDVLDDDWKEIIVFYVFHVPVAGMSARAKPLKSFGWGSKSKKDDFKQLKNYLITFGNMTKESFFCEDGWAKLKESMQKADLLEFPSHITKERVVFRKNKEGVNESLLAHIRNAFAHGRLAFYEQNNQIFIAMEDVDNQKHISARMILSKDTLKKWKTIIKSGPFITTEELEKVFFNL